MVGQIPCRQIEVRHRDDQVAGSFHTTDDIYRNLKKPAGHERIPQAAEIRLRSGPQQNAAWSAAGRRHDERNAPSRTERFAPGPLPKAKMPPFESRRAAKR